MKVYIASDHGGFHLKEKIKEYLLSKNYEVEDFGATSFDSSDDYPDFVSKAAEKVSEDENSMAVVFGKSGNGEEIVANKFENVRAIEGFSKENVRLGREDNDANILSLGSQFVDFEKAKEFIDLFLKSLFYVEERHDSIIKEFKVI